MNKIFKTFLAASVGLLAVACNLDQVSDIYTAESSDPTMLYTVYSETELDATLETVSIPVVRSNSAEATTVNLVATLPEGITVAGDATVVETLENGNTVYNTSVAFAVGASQSDCVLNVSAMEVGSSYKGSVTIAEDAAVNKNTVTMSTSFTLAKAYTWVSLGTGTFLDSFVGNYNEVEILKAEGFDLYRVMNPFPADVLTGPELGYGAAGEEFGVGGAPCPYIEFSVLEDGVHVAWDTKFSTTIDYSGAGDTIWLYYPVAYSEKYAPKADNCKFLNSEKTVVQLWGISYIEGMGGWGDSYAPSLVGFPGVDNLPNYLP